MNIVIGQGRSLLVPHPRASVVASGKKIRHESWFQGGKPQAGFSAGAAYGGLLESSGLSLGGSSQQGDDTAMASFWHGQGTFRWLVGFIDRYGWMGQADRKSVV